MKSHQFDKALEILADGLERDGKKSRRAKQDRRAPEYSAARLSIRSAAQAYIGNKELWSIGPAKVRDRYISMHKAAQKVHEDVLSMRHVVFMGPLISTNREIDPVQLDKDLRQLRRSLDRHLERLEAARDWAAARVRRGNLKGSAARNPALNCAGIFQKFAGVDPTTATDPEDLWLPEMSSGKIRRDSEGRDMISNDGWDHESTVVGPWIAAQIACADRGREPSPAASAQRRAPFRTEEGSAS